MNITEREAIEELHKIRPRGSIIPQKRAEAIDVAINALEEIEQYKALGTVDELKLAKEKQIPKKLIREYDSKIKANWLRCPTCNKGIGLETKGKKYCPECGQKINKE